ncbi:Asp23/Gls24 family envelope stress response protein [Actinomycetospora sp. CA-101289]|uniref:Asp23/Gls24 family envelope stress response protein n=1 Tax=Actinomycetospora sp. CA-101289 TaxID=3239893 RepID=UPI003D9552C0
MTTPPARPYEGDEQPDTDRLPCGAPIDRLLDQVSAGTASDRTTHQEQCPHCQAALAEYDRLWTPVRELAADDVKAPDTLLDETLRGLRGTTSDPTFASIPGPDGTTRISARVVVVTARETAEDAEGVRVALGKIVDPGAVAPGDPEADDEDRSDDPMTDARVEGPARDDKPRVVAGVAGRSTAVEITLAAQYGVDLVTLGERIRADVARQIATVTGLRPVTVSVVIDDVFI